MLAQLSSLNDSRVKHIVRYYNAWIEETTLYIQMERCHNSLRTENLTNNQRIDCFTQITSALGLIHEHDISHLDIKPDNIFIVRNSSKSADQLTFKLGDFGIAVRTGDKVFKLGDSRYADVNAFLFTKNEVLDTKKVNAWFFIAFRIYQDSSSLEHFYRRLTYSLLAKPWNNYTNKRYWTKKIRR